jgi:hypothetical protein
MEGALAEARAALRAILDQYDHDNRVMIDQVYGQLSPTLDDFYDERLTIAFPKRRPVAGDPAIMPHLTLTRVIPAGGPTRIAENNGAPFPIDAVQGLVAQAATDPNAPATLRDLAAQLASGEAWLAPRQVGRSQKVVVRVIPGSAELLAILSSVPRSEASAD